MKIACGLAACALLATACGPGEVRAEFYTDHGYTFSWGERRTIEAIAEETVRDVRPLLPALPKPVVLKVRPWKKVNAKTGDAGTISPPDTVYWSLDPDHGDGPAAIAERALRPTLHHELHHLVRVASIPSETIMDRVISEGLATVFERDSTGAPVPWGEYPDNVAEWTAELLVQQPTADREHWMFRHPDGRRWVGFKVGTYLVDCAQRASGKTAAELVVTPTDDVIALARQRCQF